MNPFEKEQILVQSPGMSQWLKIALAKDLGVTANIDFPLPATFIWSMFLHVLPNVPHRSAFNKETMTWRIMKLLPEWLSQDEFSMLQRYLKEDDDGSKRYQLAEKIADIFDAYLVYRPDWIAKWESNETVVEISDEHSWQPILWRALYQNTLEQGQSHYHRANLYQHFIEQLESSDIDRSVLPKRLFIFGISSLPPRYVDALKALGQHIDVHLMFTNPCQYYWGEIRDRKYLAKLESLQRKKYLLQNHLINSNEQVALLKSSVDGNKTDLLHVDLSIGNGLLASMGKLGRDHLYLLSQSESEELDIFIDVPRDSLLHHLQADILYLKEHQDDHKLEDSHHKQVVAVDDLSLTIHSCHSPMREIEVLHDQLLMMFEHDPELKLRDIIVMVADINAYSPMIRAVFGNALGERFIPYSISDRTAEQEHPIIAAFLQLMDLPNSRCFASELLELLETPPIMKKFEMNEDDFYQAKQWVKESGVRWGLNGTTASQFDLPQIEQNTWQFGIERMLLGYAMSDSSGLFEQLMPYNEVQGMKASLAGRLAHFIEKISIYRERLAQTQSFESWRITLNEMTTTFFSVELEDEMVLKSCRDTLTQLKEQLHDAGYTDELPPKILMQYLQNKLSNVRVSQRFLAGQVNFCTLMPMRSIPFNVVCLLGMNDGVYPRGTPIEGFDLMNKRSRIGDRSRRDDDRYLFLEALLSAQNKLYISYVGNSVQDNSQRVPSVLVSELLDYCHQNYCLVGDESLESDVSGEKLTQSLITHHAMMPFSPNAFLSQTGGSYAKEWLPVANRQGKVGGNFVQNLDDYLQNAIYPLSLTLLELRTFWRLPVQYFFNHRLNVVFDPTSPVMEDNEPFTLGALESYQLRDELLNGLLHSKNQMTSIDKQQAEGRLPIGAFGELEFDDVLLQVKALKEEISYLCHNPIEDQKVTLSFDCFGEDKPIQLTGWLDQHYQSGLLRYRSGKIRSQDYLSAWIDHLALAAMGESKPTHLIGYDKKVGVQHFIYSPIKEALQAEILLKDIVSLFYQGMTKPLAYFPTTALAGIEAALKKEKWVEDIDRSIQKMSTTFNEGYEGNNEYVSRVWSSWDDTLADESYQLAKTILLPSLLLRKKAETRTN